MTREEFMQHAEQEIDLAFRGQKNRMMNLVEQAWAEGKRNAELESVEQIGNELVNVVKQQMFPKLPDVITTDKTLPVTYTDIPEACKACPNHPSNGGSGVCFCTLGTKPATC